MLILVTGWRDHPDQSEVHRVLEDLFVNRTSTMVVVHGAARGADAYADVWCQANAVKAVPFRAEDYGRWPWCGPRRNKAMVEFFKLYPDPDKRALAFPQPDWETAKVCGTRGCIGELRAAGFEPKIYPAEVL